MSGSEGYSPRERVGRILIGPDELARDRAAQGGDRTELRSAFAISGPYVLTAWHCADRDERAVLWFRLRITDGSYCYVPVRVVSHDERLDTAVLALDGTRLPDRELTEAAARDLLTRAAIPLAAKVIGTPMWVAGFSGSKPGYDSDTYMVTVVKPDLLPSGVSIMKLQGLEFGAMLPAMVRGLSGSPVLRPVDPDAGSLGAGGSSGDVAVGLVRGSVGEDPASVGGAVIATKISDVAHLPEVGAALRADIVMTRRVPDYVHQIEQLVPAGGPPDRDAELAELAAFARPGSTRPPYAIWLGIHGSGKTTLAASFARNPPPGTDVVAFFVSRSLGGQTGDFLTYACDQLAALLGRSAVTAANSALFGALWAEAGKEAAAAGRILVLLIDGLEANDPNPSLIYRCIPRDGDDSRRVVIFSDPSAVGADHDFLLPDGKYARHELLKSRLARAVEGEINDTLETQLTDPMTDVLGVMAAAQSPLSALDIAEVLRDSSLLGQRTATARSLKPRVMRELEAAAKLGLVSPTLEDQDSYAFQDDTVRRLVVDHLGLATVGDHQDRIKDWAAGYAEQHWPESTPRYLLAGYPAMLDRTADSAGLLELTSSPGRVERLRAVTGSDIAAVDELTLVLHHLASTDPPDVALACSIALRREEMLRSMAWYPISLIQAKAMLGDWTAARSLAAHLERPEIRAQALLIIGYRATAAGKGQLGHDLLVEALKAVSGITMSYGRINAMWMAARTAVGAPWLIDPRTVAEAFTDPAADPMAVYFALNAFAVCASTAGRITDALGFLAEAYRIASAAKPAGTGPWPDMSGSAAEANQGPYQQAISIIGQPATMVARLAAASGDTGTTVQVAALIPELTERVGVLSEAHRVAAASGGRVEPVLTALLDLRQPAAAVTDPRQRVLVLATLAQAVAACGQAADSLVSDAHAAARVITRPGWRAEALTAVARAAIGCGLPVQDLLAEARAVAANGMTEQTERIAALAAIGFSAAAAGQADDARTALAADLADPGPKAWAFAIAASAAPIGGQSAGDLLAAAGDTAGALGDWAARAGAWNTIAQAASTAADLELALAAAAEIDIPDRHAAARAVITATAANVAMTDPAQRAEALAAMAQSVAACGGPGDRIFAAAQATAAGIIDPGRRGRTLGNVGQAAVLARRYAAAADVTTAMTDQVQQAGALVTIAGAVSANRLAGEPDADGTGGDDLLVDDVLSRARRLAVGLGNHPQRAALLGVIGQAALDARRYAAAEQTVAEMTDRMQRASALATIALTAASDSRAAGGATGAVSADALIDEARQAAGDAADPAQEAWALGMIIQAAVAAGNTSLARELTAKAESCAMSADPIVRATVFGVLARAASAQPGTADQLFGKACAAIGVDGNLRRSRAMAELSFLAAGWPGWPPYLAAEVDRAGGIAEPFERAQVFASLAQAADQSGDHRLAAVIAARIPDAGASIWTLTGLARSAAARGDLALADSLFQQAYQLAGVAGNGTVDWAPLHIAQAAAGVRRTELATVAAQAIPWQEYRTVALAALGSIAAITGAEPDYFPAAVFDNAWLGVTVEAASAVGWFAVADQLTALIDDLNQRAYLLLTIAGAAAAAGEPARATAAARAVLGLRGKIDRPLLGRALTIVVGGLADHDQPEARRELVAGLADCFVPDLFGIAQQLAPQTLGALTQELEHGLPGGD